MAGNINEWAAALKRFDMDLSKRLDEPRSVGIQNIERLGLPRYQCETVPLTTFLSDPHRYLAKLGSRKFYIILLPVAPRFTRKSKAGLTEEGVISFVSANVPPSSVEGYDIILQQFFENLYGGNIVIQPDGTVYAEFKEKKQAGISTGADTPKFIVESDTFTGSLRYDFTDPELRSLFYSVLSSISHEGASRERKYLPGYYEFLIVRKDDGTVGPIFIDYRDNPAYLLP